MNPFQRAREQALASRAQLLGVRANLPVPAAELLALIEGGLELGIERVAKDATELGDGDASLLRQERFIYVRNDVSAEQYAELVSHELGHWHLDAARAPVSIASLVAIARVEGSPGVVRVEAYGAKERQELQANVFAREFLLPRHVARALFLSGGTPRKVTIELGIPLKIARQQILDAVLLPMAADPPPKPLHPPSDDQRDAARAKERFVNVVAGPGTGKTSTLIHRVKYLIEEHQVDPNHILVLTFTNKAAFELVERLRASGIERAADIWAGTFHAFGLEFLRKYHDAFHLDSNIIVADKLNAITMLSRELRNLSLKHYLRVEDPYDWLGPVVQGIKRLKEELVTPQQYRKRVAQLKCEDPDLIYRRADLATLYETHERLMRAAGLVDFVDLVALPAASIRDDRARYSEFADKFQHILVDEYQDVTAAMVQLVKQMAHKRGLWVVGDVRQAIHHWRGASVKSLIVFEQTFKEQAASANSPIRKYPLELNRRSSPEILDLVTRCGQAHILQERLPLDKTRATAKSGDLPVVVSCISRAVIPDAVALAIRRAQARGILYCQQSVLCRWTAEVEGMATALRKRSIPVLYIGELSQRVEVKRFLCLMQLLSERQPRALVGLNDLMGLAMPMADIKQIMKRGNDGDLAFQRGRWINGDLGDFSDAAQDAARMLADLLKEHDRHSNPWDFLCDMLLEKGFGLPPLEDDSIDAHVSRVALWQFFHSVLAGDGDGKRPSLTRFLLRLQLRQRLGETYADRELPPEAAALDAVRVQTVHASKGLEYEAVHIGYVERDSFGSAEPGWSPQEDVKDLVPPEVLGSDTAGDLFEQAVERNNLLYVAVSRAKQQLLLYEDANWADKNRPPQLVQPGPFVVKSFAPAPTASGTTLQSPPVMQLTGPMPFEEFECYVRCPLQFWYRYGHGLRSEREPEAPVRSRFAVMAALKAVANVAPKKPAAALAETWADQHLPAKAEDPTLWRDAQTVFTRGLAMLKEQDGAFEEPETVVGGMRIRFPWVMAQKKGSSTTFHLTRFSLHGTKGVVKLLRPMLSGLPGAGNKTVLVASLLSKVAELVRPSGRVESTAAVAAAAGFMRGDCDPRPGRQCNFCAYQTICPAKPI